MANRMKTVSIVIPVFNEENTIEEIIKRVLAADTLNLRKEIIIIDDKSTDKTRNILKKIKHKNIKVLKHSKNLGKGAALRTGFKKVTGQIVIVQDADLEYHPKEFNKLLKPIVEKKTKVVYGSRELSGKNTHSSAIFHAGGRLVTLATNFLFGSNLTDEATGYKVFETDFLKSIDLKCNKFEFCPEVTAHALKRKEKIIEVPIKYSPRHRAEGKKIKAWDGIEAIWTLIKVKLASASSMNESEKRHTSWGEDTKSTLDRIIEQMRFYRISKFIKNGSKVLDLGSGYNGSLLQKLESQIKSGVGIDISVNRNLKSNKIRLLKGRVDKKIKLRSNTFDAITSLAVIEHVSNPEKMITESLRLLKKGGHLIITTPSKYNKPLLEFLAFNLGVISKTEIADHKRYYDANSLRKELIDCGFKKRNISVKYFQGGLNVFAIAKK